jgi:hypothetical protein
MKIVLNESLNGAIRRRVVASGHTSADEYVNGLIRADLERAGLIPRESQSAVRESIDASSQSEQRSRAPEPRADA